MNGFCSSFEFLPYTPGSGSSEHVSTRVQQLAVDLNNIRVAKKKPKHDENRYALTSSLFTQFI
ncbi:hypothetical protein B8W96_08465 [Lentilactobacillus parakefiri]|nr:hypothetical protein B8W96_08465 [Lentilactobacillus parakefiri]